MTSVACLQQASLRARALLLVCHHERAPLRLRRIVDCSGISADSKCCATMSGSTANSTVCRVACQAAQKSMCASMEPTAAPEDLHERQSRRDLLPLLRVCR